MDVATVTTADGTSIAYMVEGDGPALVLVPNWATNMEALFGVVEMRAWIEGLASACRLVTFDQRGSGLSDRGAAVHNMDVWLGDLDAVLDAADVASATLVAQDFGGPLALAFAARYPHRVDRLVLLGSYARLVKGDGYEVGNVPAELRDAAMSVVIDGWGVAESQFAHLGMPGPGATRERESVARVQRLASSRREVAAMVPAMFDLDVTPLLPDVVAPVLLIHAVGDRLVTVSHSRYLAERLPSSRLLELPTNQHYLFFDQAEVILDEVLGFVGAAPASRTSRRQLAVVWFSDIVGSTESVRELGDRRWAGLLDEHDRLAEHYLACYEGELVKHLGDGVLALFRSATDAVACGTRFAAACRRLGLHVRVGLHAGDIDRRADGDIAGVAVHAAQRVQAEAVPDEVLVTATVRDLLAGSAMAFTSRGARVLRGVGTTELFCVGPPPQDDGGAAADAT
jgi:pimeloyl-ACP methyl ester carboxylesterase